MRTGTTEGVEEAIMGKDYPFSVSTVMEKENDTSVEEEINIEA